MTYNTPDTATDREFAHSYAEDRPVPETPIELGFVKLGDRLEHIHNALGGLNAVIMRAGLVLAPVLTEGTYDDTNIPGVDTSGTPVEDRRSVLALRLNAKAEAANVLKSNVEALTARLEAILAAIEL